MDGMAVKAEGLTKTYRLYRGEKDRVLDVLLPRRRGESFCALRDLNFEVRCGESVGIIGLNGSGKSTLANLIAGVSAPTGGSLEVYGESAMISIAAGLKGNLTGLENIELKGLMIGLPKKEIRRMIPEIVAFSDIGDFIRQPVKTYSAGMRSRLSFAVSVNIDPDILIIDEALAVGDPMFVDKCLERMRLFRERGKTIFFVSHALSQVREFCDRAIWLEGGRLKSDGPVKDVVDEYGAFLKEYREMAADDQRAFMREVRRRQYEAGACEPDAAAPAAPREV